MARKSLGFIPLVWECPSCKTLNPGPIKTCTACGAPQPDDIAFQRVDTDKFNFIKDEALIRMAKAGPDIHCPFCGTRNPATAETCSQCGGELSRGGKSRQTGQRIPKPGEAQPAQQTRPAQPARSTQKAQPAAQAAAASASKQKSSKLIFLFVGLAVVACIAGAILLTLLLLKTDDVTATVRDVSWSRSVAIEAYTTVSDSDWWDEIPSDAELGSCSMRYRYTSDQPQANSTEVCSEAYVEDTGTGIGEVVQDCTYEVYDEYCDYTTMEWVVVETVVETGSNLNPYWPEPILSQDQRLGEHKENYKITFSGDGDTYTYTTTDSDLFMTAQPGSKWILSINQLGGVQRMEPAN